MAAVIHYLTKDLVQSFIRWSNPWHSDSLYEERLSTVIHFEEKKTSHSDSLCKERLDTVIHFGEKKTWHCDSLCEERLDTVIHFGERKNLA